MIRYTVKSTVNVQDLDTAAVQSDIIQDLEFGIRYESVRKVCNSVPYISSFRVGE